MQIDQGLEHKFTQVSSGLMIQKGYRIEGYASLFGIQDAGGDVVQPGAYAASLARLKSDGRRVKLLWQHDPAQPVGVWESIQEDAKGLKVQGRLIPETAKGAEAIALIAAGAIDGLSIGYRATKASQRSGGGRQLIEIDLWEISLVTFPMLPAARVAARKRFEIGTVLEPMARALRQAARDISDNGQAD